MKTKYNKKCPRCNCIICYTIKSSLTRSQKNNSVCKSCSKHKNAPFVKGKKWCKSCNTNKSFNLFYMASNTKDGLTNFCKDCTKKQVLKSYRKNIKRRKKTNKLYHQKNKEKRNKYHKEWHAKNKEYANEQSKKWRKENKEYASFLDRKKDRIRRARKKIINDNQYSSDDMLFTMKAFDNKCFKCNSKEDLCIDHHRPLLKGNILTISNAVVLCRSCNSSKGAKDPEEFYGYKKCKLLDKKLKKIALLYQK